jgi:hypothetical protein
VGVQGRFERSIHFVMRADVDGFETGGEEERGDEQ